MLSLRTLADCDASLIAPAAIHLVVELRFFPDAVQHIVIFLASIAAIGWASLPLGSLVFGGVLARSMFSWGMFEVDAKILLGDDDRQLIYLISNMNGIWTVLARDL
ncbi:hypothetical protein BD779DRAFT_1701138 [Infundibulicybe gibba]|nr:hypothetical protein BD779DRAFT_1701138 [Infundibulicybe gibba]